MKKLATTEIIIRSEEKIRVCGTAQTDVAECYICAAQVQLLAPELAAKIFAVSQRELLRFIESGALHFTARQSGALMICLPSLIEFFAIHSDCLSK